MWWSTTWWPSTVEFRGQQLFCQRHAHRVGDALAQGAGGGFHARGDAHFGVAGGFAVQHAEVFQLAHGQVIAREVQQSVNQHRAVAVGQHKAVAVEPMRVFGVVLQVAGKSATERPHSATAMSAMPIGAPGCPELAC